MKKLLTFVLLVAVASFAQSPFDGTWVTKLDSAQFPKKPEVFLLSKGRYVCSSCVPKIDVKADGTDQKVSGFSYFDTVAVRVIDKRSIEVTEKKDGKVMFVETDTVSPGGKRMNEKFTDKTEEKAVKGDIIFTRVAAGPAGAHAISGSWRATKVNSVSDNGLKMTYHASSEGFKMSDPNGESYDAKFDGKDYEIKGDPGHTMVSVKRIDKRTIEETDKRNGKVEGVLRLTVSPDGKMIHAVYENKRQGTTTTWKMKKES